MTEESEPTAVADPKSAGALMRGLRPRIVFEVVCLAAGVAAFLATGEVLWLIGAALVGAAPVTFYVISWAVGRRRIATPTPRPRSIVE